MGRDLLRDMCVTEENPSIKISKDAEMSRIGEKDVNKSEKQVYI